MYLSGYHQNFATIDHPACINSSHADARHTFRAPGLTDRQETNVESEYVFAIYVHTYDYTVCFLYSLWAQ